MQVSVIVPVYNAEPYVRQAVESALNEPETGEVILVEDGSPDNALPVCQALEQEYAAVRLLRHPDGQNHGAGASRNLGIRAARCDCIAFLDADDFYLPGRFSQACQLLAEQPSTDGVYEAVGTYFQSERQRQQWFAKNITDLTTVKQRVAPGQLFEKLFTTSKTFGFFHTNGVVVRKGVFKHTGLFDEHLYWRQDSAMWLKMAAAVNLIPGRLEVPVSVRRVHDCNRVSTSDPRFRYYGFKLTETLFHWAMASRRVKPDSKNLILQRYLGEQLSQFINQGALVRKKQQTELLSRLGASYPKALTMPAWWHYWLLVSKPL